MLQVLGGGHLIEHKLLLLPLVYKFDIFNRIVVYHYIFAPHLPSYLLILVITLNFLLLLLLLLPNDRFEHHLPILLFAKSIKLLHKFIVIHLLLHPERYHSLHHVKILLPDCVDLLENAVYCYFRLVVIKIFFELFLCYL